MRPTVCIKEIHDLFRLLESLERLGDVMLNELDKELEARRLDFVRYADDLIIMVGKQTGG